MIKEVGGETYPSPEYGEMLQRGILDSRHFIRIDNELSGNYPVSRLAEEGSIKWMRSALRSIPEKPWAHPDAERLDAVTFAEWLRENIDNQNARAFVGYEVSAIACASVEEISILQSPFWCARARGSTSCFRQKAGRSRTG